MKTLIALCFFLAATAQAQTVPTPSPTVWQANSQSGGTSLGPAFAPSFNTPGIAPFALTSTYTVPSNLGLVRWNQGTALAASTVTLPTVTADGYTITFNNYTAAVTALTFSPAVNGWSQGSTMAAASAIRVRWDNFTSTWQREQ